MIRKILKWTGIILFVLIAGAAVTTAARQHLTYEAPYPAIRASTDSAMIAKGRHIVLGPGHRVDCHSPVRNVDSVLALGQEVPLTGGHEFDLPFGKFFTKNLTNDSTTGIGAYTDAEIGRMLRYGVKRNNEAVLPFMPFQNMTDEDLTAVVSYLRSLKPVANPVPDHEYNLMGRVIKAYMITPSGPTERIRPFITEDSSAEYGKHMVMAVANCNECHTKRNDIGEYVGQPLAGGTVFKEEGKPTLVTPNLTPHPSGRIFNWSQDDFIRRFRQGRMIPYSHMPWESYSRMSDTELKAIYNYLRTVKAVPSEP